LLIVKNWIYLKLYKAVGNTGLAGSEVHAGNKGFRCLQGSKQTIVKFINNM
jgi:hypothetical protein